MIKIKIQNLCIAVLLLFMSSSMMAQYHSLTSFNKSYYVSGDEAHFVVHLPAVFANGSKCLEAALINRKGEIIESHYLRTDAKLTVSSSFNIPFDVQSDMYIFQLYAADKSAIKSHLIARHFVPIYNDLQPFPKNNADLMEGEKPTIDVEDELIVGISIENDVKQREAVNVEINLIDEDGTPKKGVVGISVLDKALQSDGQSTYSSMSSFVAKGLERFDYFENDIYISGQLRDQAGNPRTANILGGFSSMENRFYYSKANSTGDFLFKIPDFKGKRSLQVIGHVDEFEAISTKFLKNSLPKDIPSLVYSDEIKEALERSKQRKKMNNYFGMQGSVKEAIAEDINVQKLENNLQYVISEYESFENIMLFINELLGPLRFKETKDEKIEAELVNPNARTGQFDDISGRPLFIVDGKLTRDAGFVAKLELYHIETIDLIFDVKLLRKQFNIMGMNGVVVIKTDFVDLQVPTEDERNIVEVNGLKEQESIGWHDFQTNISNLNIPMFSDAPYWNPVINSDDAGDANATFIQSNDVGEFIIRVIARSESGEFGFGEYTYEVKK